MSDTMIDPKTGSLLEFVDGDWVGMGERIPMWQHRRILSMNLLSRNARQDISEWELHLDCGHNVRETLTFWDCPKDMYRDCSEFKRH